MPDGQLTDAPEDVGQGPPGQGQGPPGTGLTDIPGGQKRDPLTQPLLDALIESFRKGDLSREAFLALHNRIREEGARDQLTPQVNGPDRDQEGYLRRITSEEAQKLMASSAERQRQLDARNLSDMRERAKEARDRFDQTYEGVLAQLRGQVSAGGLAAAQAQTTLSRMEAAPFRNDVYKDFTDWVRNAEQQVSPDAAGQFNLNVGMVGPATFLQDNLRDILQRARPDLPVSGVNLDQFHSLGTAAIAPLFRQAQAERDNRVAFQRDLNDYRSVLERESRALDTSASKRRILEQATNTLDNNAVQWEKGYAQAKLTNPDLTTTEYLSQVATAKLQRVFINNPGVSQTVKGGDIAGTISGILQYQTPEDKATAEKAQQAKDRTSLFNREVQKVRAALSPKDAAALAAQEAQLRQQFLGDTSKAPGDVLAPFQARADTFQKQQGQDAVSKRQFLEESARFKDQLERDIADPRVDILTKVMARRNLDIVQRNEQEAADSFAANRRPDETAHDFFGRIFSGSVNKGSPVQFTPPPPSTPAQAPAPVSTGTNQAPTPASAGTNPTPAPTPVPTTTPTTLGSQNGAGLKASEIIQQSAITPEHAAAILSHAGNNNAGLLAQGLSQAQIDALRKIATISDTTPQQSAESVATGVLSSVPPGKTKDQAVAEQKAQEEAQRKADDEAQRQQDEAKKEQERQKQGVPDIPGATVAG